MNLEPWTATTMPDLDDVTLQLAEDRARVKTVELLKELHPMQPLPRVDSTGTERHGFGRRVKTVPMSEAAAEFRLNEEVIVTQNVLRGRVFELLSLHPEAESKLHYVYAVGDILGAELMSNHSALWSAMRNADWRSVAKELMNCNWERYYGAEPEKRSMVMDLILDLAS